VKTHKERPYPIRLLLTGCGTPVQPLSQFVQHSIRHITQHLRFQIKDTKHFLQKVDQINTELGPLPESAILVVCDVRELYPSVDNEMGIPAVRTLLEKFPNPDGISTDCIIEALKLCLTLNVCSYTPGEGDTILAKPCQGIAMGPAHACDFVDIFMNDLDEKLVATSPVPLLTSLADSDKSSRCKTLDWSRFRDDGITILLHEEHVHTFEEHLQKLHPPKIQWTLSYGKEVHYLDLRVKIEDGIIRTEIHTKSSHKYLPPSSCHPRSTFKGLIYGLGTKLRVNCSENATLQPAVNEYARYFQCSGWNLQKAKRELQRGASRERHELLFQEKPKHTSKIAWITRFDPRVPSKRAIIRKYQEVLYSDPENKKIFPPGTVISADRRRKNLGELYKRTVPRRFVQHGPLLEPGFHPCGGKCDFCRHGLPTSEILSSWDGRRWRIKKHLTCTTPLVVYMLQCTLHPEAIYIGSSKDVRTRWRNHKSDFLGRRAQKSGWAAHSAVQHPDDGQLLFVRATVIDSVPHECQLLQRELWWQANLGTIYQGLNRRHEFT